MVQATRAKNAINGGGRGGTIVVVDGERYRVNPTRNVTAVGALAKCATGHGAGSNGTFTAPGKIRHRAKEGHTTTGRLGGCGAPRPHNIYKFEKPANGKPGLSHRTPKDIREAAKTKPETEQLQ